MSDYDEDINDLIEMLLLEIKELKSDNYGVYKKAWENLRGVMKDDD